MSNQFKNMNFSRNSLNIRNISNSVFLQNFDSNLNPINSLETLTFSPVKLWLPILTLPKVPSPIVFPKMESVFCYEQPQREPGKSTYPKRSGQRF